MLAIAYLVTPNVNYLGHFTVTRTKYYCYYKNCRREETKGADNRLVICSPLDSESDKSNQWERWRNFSDQLLMLQSISHQLYWLMAFRIFSDKSYLIHDVDKITRRLFASKRGDFDSMVKKLWKWKNKTEHYAAIFSHEVTVLQPNIFLLSLPCSAPF
jgi:hypothetical protein